MKFKLDYVERDPFLFPYKKEILDIVVQSEITKAMLTGASKKKLVVEANGHLFYGIHPVEQNIVIREWAPNAKAIYLLCDDSNWKRDESFAFQSFGDGNWEITLSNDVLSHESNYKLWMEWEGGAGERIPAWAIRVVQDENTNLFSARFWNPDKNYKWKNKVPTKPITPLIYEAHVGMALEAGRVGTYKEFKEQILPKIASQGYNIVQLMAIQEHPYYGSFGYHVSSFFAPSSRFGTPDDLKELIDEAHRLGLLVVMDIVHSHAVKNEVEGLSCYDGSFHQFFHQGERGNHQAWDSRCFDYGKPQVLNFLLSNCKYWLQEFHFDGFRFDGVTSMMYINHGLEQDFLGYDDYFNANLDVDGLVYLRLANTLIHEINPNAITIAEDMSGFPGLAVPVEQGGIGFDFRMAMGVPDYWIKIIKELEDENWNVGEMFYRCTDKRADEKVVSYVESHDQALVGDQTLIFRLIGAEMYWNMHVGSKNLKISRGMALHKMIRMLTLAAAGGAYLNFMGNEFGHPEWIDFPREGNNWLYHYARRQWSLIENPNLRYQFLNSFDKAMIEMVKQADLFYHEIKYIKANTHDQVLAFSRGDLYFIFNFNPNLSFPDYGFLVPDNKTRKIELTSDDLIYDGFGRLDLNMEYSPSITDEGFLLKIYIPARTLVVMRILNE